VAISLKCDKFKNRFWFSACPKTGTQSIQAIIHEYFDGKYKFTPDFHDKVAKIISFDQFYKKDALFGTIRNPWERLVSNFTYQKNSVETKIEYLSKPDEYIIDYPHKQWHPKNIDWVNNLYLAADQIYNSFDNYIKWCNRFSGMHIYGKGHFKENVIKLINDFQTPGGFGVNTQTEWYAGRDIHLLYLLKIEEPESIIDFFRDVFDKKIENIPFVNVTGNGKEYRDYYTPKIIKIVNIIEQPIIYSGNYKY
jgi:hypothetical protein